MDKSETVIKISGLKKRYKLGAISGGTLTHDLQSWWARFKGKEDPNSKIGLEKKNLNKEFMALNGINLEVKKGDTIGIIGGNGAGKSTLLKILSRVTAPTEGTISIKGRISSMLEVGTGFNGEMSGRENIYMNGAILGMTKKEVDSKIDQIIAFSECEQFIDTPVKRYSSGMYVKLAFSVAAHLDSEILIMDEVLAVGDMKFQQKCLGKMGDVADREGRTVLYVSHNMNTIRQLCNRCIVLEKGKVIFNGEVEEAINVYLKNNETSSILSNKIDLSCKEHYALDENNSVLLKRFEFLEKETPIYKVYEPIKFSVELEVNKLVEDVFFRMTILYQDDTPIGMTTTDFAILGRKTGISTQEYCLQHLCLAPGKYKASVAIYSVNQFGVQRSLDAVRDCIFFEVVQQLDLNRNIPWNHKWWGHITFPSLKRLTKD